ncbi:6-bladed beta-propeller [Bacteroides sp. UBA939]|uniref:6-bladed beta-propeller n=1 Tax=Bacteroides sp. UBA939 TaxID=1946092 RepID=UPI0025C013B6|nr:6-bladed beta-propeller [Bacteroides sp. UBA939]
MNKKEGLPVFFPFDASSTIDLVDVIDTVMYVQFDDSILLSGIGNLNLTDSFIIGTNKKYGILRFDLKGRFLNTIGSVGQGPEEYQSGNYNMAVDAVNGIVYAFMYPDILLSYSLTGEFLQRVHLQMPEKESGMYCPDIFQVQNGLLYFYYMNSGAVGEKPLYWMVMNNDGTFVKCRRGPESRTSFYEGVLLVNNYTSVDDSTMIYWDNFNDTIFHVTPSSERAAYLFDKGDFRLQETDNLSSIPEERIRCSRIIDTKKFLLLTWVPEITGKEVYCNLYDKHTGITYKLRNDMIYDKHGDLSVRNMWMSYARLKGREYLVALTKAYKVENIPGALHQKLDADDLEGNPVLVLIRLKDDISL